MKRWLAVELALSRPTWDIADIAAGRGIADAFSRPTWDIADIAAGRVIIGALSRSTWGIADGRGAWRHAARSAP